MLALAVVAGGVVATVGRATVASASGGWSAPASVDDTLATQLSSVTCPTTSFCMTVGTGGNVATYNGHVWSDGPSISALAQVHSVSCASATFCAAVDYNGNAYTYNGHLWSAADALDSGIVISSVSCAPATSFCVAVSGDGGPVGFIYSGGSWSSAVTVDTASTTGMTSVSCLSASFCMAVDVSGNAVTTSDGGSTWSAPDDIDGSDTPVSVSCATTTFCSVVDSQGNAITYTGSWASPEHIGGPPMTSVSCVSGGVCVAGDSSDDGFYTTNSGSSWTADVGVGPDEAGVGLAVACQTTTFCVVVDGIGQVFAYNSGSWTSPVLIDEIGSDISSVSCVSSIFCAAVDVYGNALTYNGSTWSAPVNIDGYQLDAVSCATPSLCVAVDNNGEGSTYNGTSWSGLSIIDPDGFGLTSVSCTATPTTFCAAIDSNGNVFTSTDGVTWSSLAVIDPDAFLTSVSCATASFCMAVDAFGYALHYDGTSWSGPQDVDHGQDLDGVSCTTTPSDFCAAVDQAGNGVSYNGSWSAPFGLDSNSTTSISCAAATFCQAADQAGHVEAFDQSTLAAVDPGNILTAISCPTVSFCATVDDVGNVAVYQGMSNGVSVSDVSPDTGPTTGGTPVTITGTGFTVGSVVDFAGVEATDIDVENTTTITADAPVGSAGTVDVIVGAAGGFSIPNPADQFTYAAVQSPSNTGCDPSCTETVSTPVDQTQVTVTGASDSPTSNVSLVVNTDTLTCGGVYHYATPVTTLSSTNFAVGATVTATETVGNEPTKTGVKVCYAASSVATSGSFLGKCHGMSPVAPCTKSLVEDDGSVVVTLLVPATDPRFWSGSSTLDLTSFSPTHGAPGKKITIKGKDLSQVTAVVIGGTQARILSESSSKVTLEVPQGAVTGDITVTADSGDGVSIIPFTVS